MRAKLKRQSITRQNKKVVEDVNQNTTIDDDNEDNEVTIESDDQMNGTIDDQMNGKTDETIVKSPKGHSKKKNKSPEDIAVDMSLMKTIIDNDKYFSSLIDLIPPKIYFEGNEEILESMESQKRERTADKTNLSAKVKQKHFKLDPNCDHKVSEIANHFYGKQTPTKKSQQMGKQTPKSMDNKMQELRVKLDAKISQLKSTRGQKINAKQLRESKKQRKNENALRARKQKGFAKRQSTDDTTNDQNNNTVVDDNGLQSVSKKRKLDDNKSSDAITSDKKRLATSAADKIPKIYNKEGNIVYSKFDFVSTADPSDKKQKNSKKNKLKKLLVKTKKDEQKMSELEATDASKAQTVKEKKLWRNVIEKSEGHKVKDSSKMIDKSLRRRDMKKKKSAKEWAERKETLDNRMKAKSDKRKRNIEKRKTDKKEKNRSKNRKKGRIFDGK